MHAFGFKFLNHLISVCYLEEHWIIMIKTIARKVVPLKTVKKNRIILGQKVQSPRDGSLK